MNPEERWSYDDGDQLQKCKSKGASTWLTRLGICASATGATLMLSDSSEKWEITARGYAKVFGRKRNTGRIQLRYIDDIHVIDVFFIS